MALLLVLLACTAVPPAGEPVGTADTADTAVRASTPVPTASPTTPPDAPPLELCVNELMASNTWSYTDETGARPDWIELHNPGATDVGLGGWYLGDDATDPFAHPLSGGLVVPAGGFLVLTADAKPELGPLHLPFTLDVDGEEVALFRADGSGEVIRFGALSEDLALSRSPDCCADVVTCAAFVWGGTPGASNVPPVFVEEELVPRGSVWRWRADPAPPPVDWASAGFDDSGWPADPGYLGYGDYHIVTEIPYGPDPNAKWTAYQFRLDFDALDVDQVTDLWLDLARDDGAVVYLNGVEVLRSNLPAGALGPATLATTAVGDGDEYSYQRWTLDPGHLVEGANTLAVDVRQAAATSSDLGFDLGVVVQRLVP